MSELNELRSPLLRTSLASDPLVCAVLLTRDRPEMARQAVESFRRQTYANKTLLVWDTSSEMDPAKRISLRDYAPDVQHAFYGPQEYSIGALRNHAIKYGASEVVCSLGDKELSGPPDIICHFDDDDWSHPNRIAEQVALLQSSGCDAVGYHEALFWQTSRQATEREIKASGLFPAPGYRMKDIGLKVASEEAWLYTAQPPRPVIGASLCYWRRSWERKPFPDLMTGEDLEWQSGIDVKGASSLPEPFSPELSPSQRAELGSCAFDPRYQPRLICRIHSSNTCSHITPSAREWKRTPQWDDYCRRTFENA